MLDAKIHNVNYCIGIINKSEQFLLDYEDVLQRKLEQADTKSEYSAINDRENHLPDFEEPDLEHIKQPDLVEK